jgi:hypothetical protein
MKSSRVLKLAACFLLVGSAIACGAPSDGVGEEGDGSHAETTATTHQELELGSPTCVPGNPACHCGEPNALGKGLSPCGGGGAPPPKVPAAPPVTH